MVYYLISLTGGCLEATIKDTTRQIAEIVPRKRPTFLLLPYITHTLSMKTTVNVFSVIIADYLVEHTFYACKADLSVDSVSNEYTVPYV